MKIDSNSKSTEVKLRIVLHEFMYQLATDEPFFLYRDPPA